MKGIILSAGMGTRLQPLTLNQPKCLVNVAGKPMMEYQLDAIGKAGIRECTIVVGFMADAVRHHFGSRYRGIAISYVENTDYASTNNLCSLWLAKDQFDDDILLLESDLVFDDQLISRLVSLIEPNIAVVDRFQSHMDGTVILAERNTAKSMVLKSDQSKWFNYSTALKTVNIYRLSKQSLSDLIVPEMESFLDDGRSDQYYEAVFASLIGSGRMEMCVMTTGNNKWAEIDDIGDLRSAEEIFAPVLVR